jgi:hypothetical protein
MRAGRSASEPIGRALGVRQPHRPLMTMRKTAGVIAHPTLRRGQYAGSRGAMSIAGGDLSEAGVTTASQSRRLLAASVVMCGWRNARRVCRSPRPAGTVRHGCCVFQAVERQGHKQSNAAGRSTQPTQSRARQ